MSPLNEQKLNQIRDMRREQIKLSALKMFALRGFKGTKTSLIAKEAGISEGLIYRYFNSKDELFYTLVKELLKEGDRELENLNKLPGTPFEQFKSLTLNMLDKENKYPFMLIHHAREAEGIPENVKQILAQYSANTLMDRLLPLFIKGQQLGEFSAGDARKLLSWYFYTINSLIMQKQENKEYGMPHVDMLMRLLS